MGKPTKVPCPTCGREAEFFAEPIGPFCSARCKMADLGKWLAEDYRISEPLSAEHFSEYEQLEGEQLDKPED
ncbi:MAG: uncharacterized protein QOD99_123 [Chthoniobacter sp.]|jgi:endogenous inhibitor of DNA gyrase (YacG/DUF329 family)|nr:uncharacterized protein [Chthoniobacter sp.]